MSQNVLDHIIWAKMVWAINIPEPELFPLSHYSWRKKYFFKQLICICIWSEVKCFLFIYWQLNTFHWFLLISGCKEDCFVFLDSITFDGKVWAKSIFYIFSLDPYLFEQYALILQKKNYCDSLGFGENLVNYKLMYIIVPSYLSKNRVQLLLSI